MGVADREEGYGGLERRAIAGVPWTVFAFASSKFFGVATTLVLARVLVPADFGVFAVATLVIGAVNLFSDLGLRSSLVVHENLDDTAEGTVLTLMLGVSVVAAAICAAFAPIAGEIFDEPRLPPVLAVLSVTLVVGSVGWFFDALLQRQLEFARRFRALLAQGATFAIVALSTAAAGAGVWSLVAGQVAATAVYSATLMLLVSNRVKPRFELAAARDALRGGRGFAAQGALAFAELNVDYLAVGRLLGAAELGYYSMAFRLSELPYWAITEPVAQVTFPAFASMRSRGKSVAPAFGGVLRLVTLLACPLGVLLSAASEPFTETVLGDAWLPMTGTLAILGIWGALCQYEATLGWLFNSLGEAGLNAQISGVAVIPLLVGVVLAAQFGDLEAVALVVLGHALLSVLTRAIYAERRLGIALRGQWTAVRPAATGAVAAWVVARLSSDLSAGLPPAAALVLSVSAGVGAYAIAASIIDRDSLPSAARQIRTILLRRLTAANPRDP